MKVAGAADGMDKDSGLGEHPAAKKGPSSLTPRLSALASSSFSSLTVRDPPTQQRGTAGEHALEQELEQQGDDLSVPPASLGEDKKENRAVSG